MERNREQKDRVFGSDSRELRQRSLVVADVFDDVEGSDQNEDAVGKGNRSHAPAHRPRATPAQLCDGRCALVDEMGPLDRQARSEPRGDLEPPWVQCDETADQRPGIEPLGLDQTGIRPERVIELAVRLAPLPIASDARVRSTHRNITAWRRVRSIQVGRFKSSETVEHSRPFSRSPRRINGTA